jgi:type 2 lantibiotic biosynthesis protein LanM
MRKTRVEQTSAEIWQAPAWYNALSLADRLGGESNDHRCTAQHARKNEAAHRLQDWKTQTPFENTALFAQRLADDALTEEQLLALLTEKSADVQARTPSTPAWLVALKQAFASYDPEMQVPISPEILAEYSHISPYLQALNPLLQHGFATLYQGFERLQQRYSPLPFDAQAVCQKIANSLIPQLLSQIGKTMVLELHVARVQGQLRGETAEERFQDFLRQLSRPERLLTLLTEYPVLARLVVSAIDLWAGYTLETLEHFCADLPDIRALFTPESDPGPLVEIQGGMGDRHRGGRSVQILAFRSGFRLLYKPKPLAMDKHFQELLAWLNEQGAEPQLRLLKVLDRGEYGWTEFVEAAPCTSREELVRFYERQGAYLALFYALNTTDCHSENIIASGEHPVLIDLESLLHPSVDPASTEPDNSPLQAQALQYLHQSVLRVGLLPQWSWAGGEDAPGVDLSGLGGQPGQMMPHRLPGWEGAGTDQMHLTMQRLAALVSQNRPQLNEREVRALDYQEDIVRGFTRMYRLLSRVREPLLSTQLPRFARDRMRVILRPTRFYALLLLASYHPDLLRDALERDRFFDRLWLNVDGWSDLARFIPAERQDLWMGDIPCFTTTPESRTIYTADGTPVMDLYKVSALELTERQLRSLNECDLVRQTWIIKASLAMPHMGTEKNSALPTLIAPHHQPVERARLLSLSSSIGKRLEELLLPLDTHTGWLGMTLVRKKTWDLQSLRTDLYDGISGIALFLAYLGAITGETSATNLARRALASVRQEFALARSAIEEWRKHPPEDNHAEQHRNTLGLNVGVFDGWSSFIYLLTHLSQIWHEPTLAQEAEELAAYLPELIAHDEHFDIIHGTAGCLLSLLSLYAIHPSPRVLDIAIQCGMHLLATARTFPVGLGWVIDQQEQPLASFSHGNAGIAMSLLKLAQVSGEEQFRQTALKALAYERSLFVPEYQNWADLRPDEDEEIPESNSSHPSQRFMVAWCHGAPGIGLARLNTLAQLDDKQVRQEIDIALATTSARGLGLNHSLCHGSLGNIDLLLTAAHVLNRQEDHERLGLALSQVVKSIETHGWATGVPLGVEIPGLMTGLAGMGYELLRLAKPEQVPSVLLIAPPIDGTA